MISIQFSINNPWAKNNFKNILCKSGMMSKNRAWEFEVLRHNFRLFDLSFMWTTKQDHAGPNIVLALFGYHLEFRIYDTRHWDYENDCWITFEKSGE